MTDLLTIQQPQGLTAPPQHQSPTLGKLAEALAKAQAVIEDATKDRTNPFFNRTYATLSSVWDACRKPLTDNGLAVVQQVNRSGAEVSVRTLLIHTSGEWVASVTTLPVKEQTAQGYGSAITYGRRYGLAAIVGVAPDEDDDGNTATKGDEPSGPIKPPQQKSPPPSPAQPLPPGRQLTGVKVPASFKNSGGKDLAEIEAKELSSLADYFLKASEDPSKARYAAQNKALHDACVLEGMKR